MTFQVGLTGHRDLTRADQPALRDAAAAILSDLAQAVHRLHADDQSAPSPLHAPDPAVLRCVCGLAEGADTLLAEAALGEGWSLVAVLPFARAEFERDFPADAALARFNELLARADSVCELDGVRTSGGEPYAAVGQVIVEQSDLLLAVWDGLPPRGPGGTGDVARQALSRGLPVAVLPPAATAPPLWRGSPGASAAAATALLPSLDPAGFPRAFLEETGRGTGWAGRIVRLFETIMLLGTTSQPPPPAPPPTGDPALLRFFEPADRLAGLHAARYRVAGLLRYALVLPATLGAFVGFYGPPWVQGPGFLLQIASLVIILWFSARGLWEDAQRRYATYRLLAEYLRNARLLHTLGAVPSLPGTPAHEARTAAWPAWYARAAVREVGLAGTQPGRAAASFIAAETRNELAFLQERATRFALIAKRLKWIGVALFMSGIIGAALRSILYLDSAGAEAKLLVNEAALALPAMAPVFLGLLGFGEYSRLASRYRAVAAALEEQLEALGEADGRSALLPIAHRITDIMLAESSDWHLIITSRTVSAY